METKQKTRVGRVISDKMEKTVVVAIEKSRQHTLYRKSMKSTVKYKVHDPKKECHTGDIVRIVETRPISKEKRWRIAEVVTKKEVVNVQPKEIV
ncbi:MAG: 30S ribosomal protein S17 [Chloroflexota bacterium]